MLDHTQAFKNRNLEMITLDMLIWGYLVCLRAELDYIISQEQARMTRLKSFWLWSLLFRPTSAFNSISTATLPRTSQLQRYSVQHFRSPKKTNIESVMSFTLRWVSQYLHAKSLSKEEKNTNEQVTTYKCTCIYKVYYVSIIRHIA